MIVQWRNQLRGGEKIHQICVLMTNSIIFCHNQNKISFFIKKKGADNIHVDET